MNFPVHFSSQLRQHLKALRKARGLTQASLGQLLGVGQARIAEIESKPGVVSVDQLMKLLAALRVSMVLRDDAGAGAAHAPGDAAQLPAVQAPGSRTESTPRRAAKASVEDQRRGSASTGSERAVPQPVPVPRSGSSRLSGAPGAAGPARMAIRPKKGSW